VALSRKFIWVLVDRDQTPELPKKFSVSAYPSLLVLGKDDENIHRWAGFRKPPEFLPQLEEALKRYELYAAGKPFDVPTPRAAKICDTGDVTTLKAPGEEVPGGVAQVGGSTWVALGEKLHRLDTKTGAVQKTVEHKRILGGLATDGKLLYAADYGWNVGEPILVLDGETGETKRTIVSESMKKNKGGHTRGIAWRDGKLHLLWGSRGTIYEVDPETGEVAAERKTGETWLAGLAWDGARFATATAKDLLLLDGDAKAQRKVALNYPVRAIGRAEGAWLLLEQPVSGFDRKHQPVRVWPKETLIHRLALTKE
jgi:hypothetical protein